MAKSKQLKKKIKKTRKKRGGECPCNQKRKSWTWFN